MVCKGGGTPPEDCRAAIIAPGDIAEGDVVSVLPAETRPITGIYISVHRKDVPILNRYRITLQQYYSSNEVLL